MCAVRIDLEQALARLRAGDLVAVPTETVYGLAADAHSEAALAGIFRTKGRPASNPLIVHILDRAALDAWVTEVPAPLENLLRACWPGPLTVVLPARSEVSRAITAGADTVAVRCPSHPLFRDKLARFGRPLCAPSANRSGYVSPTRAEHLLLDYADQPVGILDGGECELGIESTIVRPSGDALEVLRPGAVPMQRLRALWPGTVGVPAVPGVVVPGSSRRHYAPTTRLRLVARSALSHAGRDDVVVCFEGEPFVCTARVVTLPRNVERYAARLYALLRELDAAHHSQILIERLPEDEAWQAVMDRLQRAAAQA